MYVLYKSYFFASNPSKKSYKKAKKKKNKEAKRMKKGIKGEMINIVMIMCLMVVMGCNSGGVKGEEGKGTQGIGGLGEVISHLREGFLEVFVSFGNILKDTFGLTSNTTKKEVGERLGKIGEAVEIAKGKLEGIKGTEQFSLMKDKVDSVITNAVNILKKLVEGTKKFKEATDGANGKIGNANGTEDAVQADIASVKSLVEGINMIYEAAKEVKVDSKGNADKTIADSKAIAKLFNDTASADATGLKAANVALNSSSGADILAAIDSAKNGINAPAGQISAAKNAYDIAVAIKNSADAGADVREKGSVITAGLALRAMAKNGKLATHANVPAEGLNAVLIGAVSKTVNEIVSTIRRTVDKCLKDVNDCIKEGFSSVVKS
ncbi:vlp protein (plasmid) [Borrelia recurrentis A1]|uniref:Variable large protein n=2 Tax=Borrelia recurrentis TaxID=44449 RepID=B5RS56_BORRA|nr:vlp protein [Borrelia recurrentis A1]